jgi:ABC-2 type transport system ATP-binding protein
MTTEAEYAIEVDKLTKRYGDLLAVDDISFAVRTGEVFAFLGPNGAGKTTSIKMLLGLMAPSSGSARLLGAPLGDRATRARMGFLPEHFRFQDWLTAEEFLDLHGRLYGMEPRDRKRRADELLERVGLTAFRRRYLRTFSKGMLQRIGLAQALLNRPQLVFLDEPTSGLDPVGRRLVRDIIGELRAAGTAVFLNSHLLSEIEVTCERVAFIRHGEVIRTLELASLERGLTSLVIRAEGLTAEAVAGLSRWGRDVRAAGDTVTMELGSESAVPEITRHLVACGAAVHSINPRRASLEEIFIETIGKDGGL